MASSSEPGRRGYAPPQNDQERLLQRRTEDLCRIAQNRGIARYSGFLSDREQLLAQAALDRLGCDWGFFEGGWPGAERKLLCLEPAGASGDPPICCVILCCAVQPGQAPAHKDYLGSLLGLGLERECVGDILLDPARPGTAYAFLLERAAALACAELVSVGRFSARAEMFQGPVPVEPPQRELKTVTVASLRADAVLAAMLHVSRGQAEELIRGGRVEICHLPISSGHAPVYEGDIFTVRGIGRFKLESLGGKSRKDRLFIQYFQY